MKIHIAFWIMMGSTNTSKNVLEMRQYIPPKHWYSPVGLHHKWQWPRPQYEFVCWPWCTSVTNFLRLDWKNREWKFCLFKCSFISRTGEKNRTSNYKLTAGGFPWKLVVLSWWGNTILNHCHHKIMQLNSILTVTSMFKDYVLFPSFILV